MRMLVHSKPGSFAPTHKVPEQILRISSTDRTCFESPTKGACVPAELREQYSQIIMCFVRHTEPVYISICISI